ncbi:MAG: 4-phosphopantetheinyl transferase [Planctomycetes bacterium]|nr:4-phosphopantetheinyl transferase [Planctomycetota bacterium]
MSSTKAQVWFAEPDAITDSGVLARYRDLLSDDERVRCDRFVFDKDRHHFLVAHALVRTVVGQAVDRDPASLGFDLGVHGRPELRTSGGPPPVRFNLSHTSGLVAVAVTSGLDIGVDVERLRDVNPGVAEKHFAAQEVRALEALPESGRRPRFFAYWTLKESYIKARGMGLALPLGGFAFDLDADPGRIGFSVRDDLDDRADAWRFVLWSAGPEHRAALAVRARELHWTTRRCVPLVNETEWSWDVLAY